MITLPSKLEDSILKIVKDEAFVSFSVEINIVPRCGNALSELYEITIKGETVQGKKETNIFVKQKINLTKINFFPIDAIFSKEEFIYNDLSKVFTYLQDQANVPIQERYRMTKSYAVTNEDVIILDNLSKKKFKIYKLSDDIPLEFMELAIVELAKFHGFSFIIENKMPEYFNKKIKTSNHLLHYDEDWRKLIRRNVAYIASLYDDNCEIKRKIENFLPVIFNKFPQYHYNKGVKCTLTHGDYRISNILVKEKDGKPVEVVPIDYQLIDYGCPIRDLFLLIFSGTDQEFRRKNLTNLKDLYFSSLLRFLKYFDIDVENVFPREEFERIYSEWLDYGLMIVIVMSTFLFPPGTGVDIQDIRLSDMSLNLSEHAICMIRGCIDDFIDWGYL